MGSIRARFQKGDEKMFHPWSWLNSSPLAQSTMANYVNFPSYYNGPMATTHGYFQYSLPEACSLYTPSTSYYYSNNHSCPSTIKTKNSRSKIKVNSVPTEKTKSSVGRIFIWDLDETIVILNSLLNGRYAHQYNKDPHMTMSLALQMEEMICQFADNQLFAHELKECDQVNIDDHLHPSLVRSDLDWTKTGANRYRYIKEIYRTHRFNLQNLFDQEKYNDLIELHRQINRLTDSWLELAMASLKIINQRKNCVNVMVTNAPLVPSLGKVLIYGLAHLVELENIYSSHKISRDQCFERIQSRFGRGSTYIVVGDGHEGEFAAKQLTWPFWRIHEHQHLRALTLALEWQFL